MLRVICFFCFLLFINPLWAKPKTHSTKAPSWIFTPYKSYNRDDYVAAVGQSRNKDTSEIKAIENLASFFGQNIDSNEEVNTFIEQLVEEGTITTNKSSSISNLSLRSVNQVDLIGINIVDSFYDSTTGDYYSLAVMNKMDAFNIYASLITKNTELINKYLKYKGEASFNLYNIKKTAYKLSLINELYLNRLKVLSPGQATNYDKFTDSKTILLELKKISNQIPVYVNVEGDQDSRIKSSFQKVLSDYGFPSSTQKSRFMIIASLSHTSFISSDKRTVYTTYALDASMIDTSSNKVLFPVNYKGREGSINEVDSLNRIYKSLENKINTDFGRYFNSFIDGLKVDESL